MKQFVKGFHHFGLPTADMDATIAFYSKLGADIVFETVVTEAGKPCRVVHLQVNNLFDAAYESNGWVYSYILGGERYRMDGYFPQAGRHFMAGLSVIL